MAHGVYCLHATNMLACVKLVRTRVRVNVYVNMRNCIFMRHYVE